MSLQEPTSTPVSEFDNQYAAEQLRRSWHPLRKLVKGFYLRNIVADVRGATIDFGCGAGQLLAQLPQRSVGFEVNSYLIDELRRRGFNVYQARAEMRDFELVNFEPGYFHTLVIAHVLEHLPDPAAALHVLFAACARLGIDRVIVVVPGVKGFKSDHTRKTFIDRAYLDSHIPHNCNDFVRTSLTYFPGPWEAIGKYFIFHEMKVIYDRIDTKVIK